MTPPPLRTGLVRCNGRPAPFDWADGLHVQAPEGFFDQGVECLEEGAPPGLRFDAAELARFRERAVWTKSPPITARLPFSYRHVPAWARTAAARMTARAGARRLDREDFFPRWPLDLSIDFLADLLDPPTRPPGPSPVLVSHDIDSAEGLENLVRRFVPLEESLGLRSVNYLVPCGWPLDHGLLRELVARGHRLGIHGCDHSNRTPFCGAEERRRRIAAALPLVERYGIQGYRAPSLCRTPELFDELVRHFRYDSSIPTSGGLFPVPGNGCATARPFVLRGLTEVPITLPRDGSLLFLGYSPEAVLSLWKECAARLIRSGGWVVLLTHCERRFSGSEGMFKAYTAFLEHLRALDGVSFVTEAEVVESLGAGGKGPPQP